MADFASTAPNFSKEELMVRLRELSYDTNFPDEAAPVINRLLFDLLKSVKSCYTLRVRCEELHSTVQDQQDKWNLNNEDQNHLKKEVYELQQKINQLEGEKLSFNTSEQYQLQQQSTSAGGGGGAGDNHSSAIGTDLNSSTPQSFSKITEATERVSELENDLEKMQTENQKLQLRMQELQIDLQSKMEEQDRRKREERNREEEQERRIREELNHEKAQMLTVKAELLLKQQEVHEAHEELKVLKFREQSVSLGAESLDGHTRELTSQITDNQQKILELNEQKTILERDLEKALQHISVKDQEFRNLQISFETAKEQGEISLRRIASLESTLENERQRLRQVDIDSSSIRVREGEAKQTSSMLNLKIRQLDMRNSDLESEVRNINDQCQSLTRKLTETRYEKSSLEQELDKEQRQNQNKETEIARLHREAEKEQQRFDLEKSTLVMEIEKHKNTITHLRADIDAKHKEILNNDEVQARELETVQHECVSLAQQNQKLSAQLEQLDSAKGNCSMTIERLQSQLKCRNEEKEEYQVGSKGKIRQLEAEIADAAKLRETLENSECISQSRQQHFQDERIARARDGDRLRKQIRDIESKYDNEKAVALATQQHLESENKQYLDKISDLNSELEQQKDEFSTLKNAYKSLASLRDQVQEKLNTSHRQLEQLKQETEIRAREGARSMESATGEREEKEALQRALLQMDTERDSIREEADRKTVENRELRLALDEQSKIRIQMEEAVEDLRRQLDIQGQQLTDREKNLQEHANMLEGMKSNLDVLRAENTQFQRDLGVFRADLSTMTNENQALNDHIISQNTQIQALTSEKRQMEASFNKEASEHNIRTMERDDMLQLYKETVTENQRIERTVQVLQHEKEESLKKISDFVSRNQSLQMSEEKAVADLRQEQMNVSSLKTQVSQLVARLQESHQDVEEKTRAQRNLERDVYLGGQHVQEIEGRRCALEREVLVLKSELDKRIHEGARLKNDIQVQEAATQFEKKRADKLEMLMTETRRKQLEFEQKIEYGIRMDDESEQTTMMLYDPA